MPFRSKQTLEAWLEEFRTTREGGGLITVLIQDGDGGADTGLVVVPLRNSATEIVMQPASLDDPKWIVTIGAPRGAYDLSPAELQGMAAELGVAASLCQFLQEKSVDHDEALSVD
ncbi:hypothetical protein ACEXQD_16210 [Herbiconiux sp. P15]|uniref:hypothetical protein n=1 Tax=Herbiconiux liukaitaii TaxID=3342799 RepID=UPI0035B8B6C9